MSAALSIVATALVLLTAVAALRLVRQRRAVPPVVSVRREPAPPLGDEEHRDLEQLERDELEAYVATQIWEFLDDKGLWLPNGSAVDTVFRPVEGIGGDFLGTMTDGSRAIAYVGDVAGHGLDSALVALRLKAAVGDALQSGVDIAETTTRANDLLNEEVAGLATFFICSVEGERLEYVNAGQVSPLVFADQPPSELPSTGPVLGAIDHAYELGSFPVDAGDRVVAFTDGVTDAYRAAGGLSPEEARAAVAEPGSLQALVDAVEAKLPEPVCDDIAAFELTVGD